MYSTAVAFVLGILSFAPPFSGLLRFYLGHNATGVAYTLTAGLCWIGNILDIVKVPQLVHEANTRWRRQKSLPSSPQFDSPEQRPHIAESQSTDTIEKTILLSAKNNRGVTTPSEIALETGVSLEEAKEKLDSLVTRGFADLQVKKSGVIVYIFPEIVEMMKESEPENF